MLFLGHFSDIVLISDILIGQIFGDGCELIKLVGFILSLRSIAFKYPGRMMEAIISTFIPDLGVMQST